MKKFGLGFLCAMTLVANAAFGALTLKDLIDISGAVGDSMGNPLTQTMDYRVRFFDDATAGMQIGSDVLGSVTPESDGSFNIAVIPPATVTEMSDSWYELALDTNGNGIDANDVFGQRVPIHAVPYAINSGSLNGMDSLEFATDLELAAGLAGRAATPHSHLLQDLGGAVTDSQVPDNITITEADTLDDVTGRGNMTANAITVGEVTSTSNISGAVLAISGSATIGTATLGDLLSVNDASDEVCINGPVKLGDTGVPSVTDEHLYNNGGNLYWNGTQLDAAGGGGGGTLDTVLVYGNPTGSAFQFAAFNAHADGSIVNAQVYSYIYTGMNDWAVDIRINGTTVLTGNIIYTDGTITAGVLKSNGDETFSAGDTISFHTIELNDVTGSGGLAVTAVLQYD